MHSRKDRDQHLTRLDKALKDKDYELEKLLSANRALEDEVRQLRDKCTAQEKSYQDEYDRKFEELKQMYFEQIEKQKRLFMGSANDQDVIEGLKDELRKLAHDKIIQEELVHKLETQAARYKDKYRGQKGKISELEQTEKLLASQLNERERELERDRGSRVSKEQKLEVKLQRKSDKLMALVAQSHERE